MSAVSCQQKVAKDMTYNMTATCRHHVGYVELVGRYGGKTKASAKLVVSQHVGETWDMPVSAKVGNILMSGQHVADIIQPSYQQVWCTPLSLLPLPLSLGRGRRLQTMMMKNDGQSSAQQHLPCRSITIKFQFHRTNKARATTKG